MSVTWAHTPDRVSTAKDVIITVAGIAGSLGFVWLLCAGIFELSIVIFRTGSMAPAIPSGSAAVVREIPASEIVVGDIITVQRSDAALPITHRVVSVATDPEVSGGRIVTLKGDANGIADVVPYELTEARIVLVSFAGVGTVFAILHTPYFLAVMTILVALLVVWAFWPRGEAFLAVPPTRGAGG